MYEYTALVTRVIDGDTVSARIDLGFALHYETPVRLAGINAPELHTPAGPGSKAHLEALLLGKTCVVQTRLHKEWDKYGRVLGTFLLNGQSINLAMLTDGFAVPMASP